jgi:hypothetical protein
MFAGDWNTYFDSSGLGLATLPWDGWAIANGNNGTMNLTNRFVVPGYRCDGWYLWVTKIDGYDAYTGGRSTFKIALNNLPYLSITFQVTDAFEGGGGWFGVVSYGSAGQGIWTYPITGTGSNNDISLIPPYIALGFAQFIGYTT